MSAITRYTEGILSEKTAWKVVNYGTALLAGLAVRQAIKLGYRYFNHEQPPQIVPHRAELSQAVAWTLATSVAVGLSRLVIRRGAAAGWQVLLGTEPPE